MASLDTTYLVAIVFRKFCEDYLQSVPPSEKPSLLKLVERLSGGNCKLPQAESFTLQVEVASSNTLRVNVYVVNQARFKLASSVVLMAESVGKALCDSAFLSEVIGSSLSRYVLYARSLSKALRINLESTLTLPLSVEEVVQKYCSELTSAKLLCLNLDTVTKFLILLTQLQLDLFRERVCDLVHILMLTGGFALDWSARSLLCSLARSLVVVLEPVDDKYVHAHVYRQSESSLIPVVDFKIDLVYASLTLCMVNLLEKTVGRSTLNLLVQELGYDSLDDYVKRACRLLE